MLNFINLEESIIKQCTLKKISGKKKQSNLLKNIFKKFSPSIERWFVFTTDGIGYISSNKKKNKNFREYNYFPYNFKVNFDDNHLQILFGLRILEFKFDKDLIFLDVTHSIAKGYLNSSITEKKRFDSFCKPYY